MKLSRQWLVGGLAASCAFWLYRFAQKINLGHPFIPGDLLGASAKIGHQLRSGGFPPPTQQQQKAVVIIGAGISGLAAGYRLAKAGLYDFAVLDLEQQVGGNACSGRNGVCAYSWGAHYVPLLTEESTGVRTLFEELGVITGYDEAGLPHYNEYYICHDPNERLFRYGRWQDGLVPTIGISAEDKKQYRRFFDQMAELKNRKGKDGRRLFAIPVDLSSRDQDWLGLDQLTMAHWLDGQRFTSEPLRWYINYCCRDDFGTTLHETSAWVAIHYFAARNGRAANTASDSVITWPEGNGWLVEKLAQPIQGNIITQGLCFSLVEQGPGVEIQYFDAATEQTVSIAAQAAIVATPRFVAARLLKSSRFSFSADGFSYSPWAVANITLSQLPGGKGAPLSWDNVVFNSELLGYVNAVHQITQMQPTATVLTYYWPLSHLDPAKAREEALNRGLAEWQRIFLQELLRIHPELEGHVERVDIWLWGHGMVRPTPGFVWGKIRQQALTQQPPIFTAHSDMSGISIFEEAYTHGIRAAERVLAHLAIPYISEL
jgi:phytoene dehydrogenase-like protein